ncbi:MAG TPA: hypothetical protein VGM87_09455 [Roseomonas sp.]|jgi:hypothetical protein
MRRPAAALAVAALIACAAAGPPVAQEPRPEPGVACDARLAEQFPDVTRRLAWRGDPPAPQQLADADIPTEAQAQDLRRLHPLANQCMAMLGPLFAGDPRATAALDRARRSRDQVFRLLIWRNGSWGEANDRLRVAGQQFRRDLQAAGH